MVKPVKRTLFIKSFMPVIIIWHPPFNCFAEFGWWFNQEPVGQSFLSAYVFQMNY